MDKKSICVFTSFWDANSIIDLGYFSVNNIKENKFYKINVIKKTKDQDKNFFVNSIALSNPNLSKQKNMINIGRVDCLCPTYDMLKRYKNDKNWSSYQKEFIDLIKNRKESINKWADSLEPNCVYFLCCWENTVNGAHCHREIIYKAFSSSKKMSEKIIPVYRHGEKNYKDEIGRVDYRREIVVMPDVIHRDDDIIRRERRELSRQIRNGDVVVERINPTPVNWINRQILEDLYENDNDPPF